MFPPFYYEYNALVSICIVNFSGLIDLILVTMGDRKIMSIDEEKRHELIKKLQCAFQ